MSKVDLDKVQIVEPPIGELSKKPSRIKYGCLGCVGGIILLIVGTYVAVRLAVGPGPETLSAVPASFPTDIPVYAKDNIESITFIPGRYKHRGAEIASILPKVFLAPLFLPSGTSTNQTGDERSTWAGIKKIWQYVFAPVGDNRDTVQIEWRNLDAEPTFVFNYYKTELTKKDYNIDEETKSNTTKQFTFSNNQGVSGSLSAQGDEENRPGTDYAVLTVNLPK